MSNFRFMVGRIFSLNYGNMFEIAKEIGHKTNKPSFAVLCDIVNCGLRYQAGYNDYREFEFYKMNGKERRTYLTRGKNNKIVRRYNQKDHFYIFEDKVVFNEKFNNFLGRDWIDLKTKPFEDFEKFIAAHHLFIAKIVDGEGGEGIERYDANDYEAKKLYDLLTEKKQFLLEEFVTQHDDLNVLYSNSVNTMRMFTFFDGERSYFLQAILKVGNGGVVDNFSSGGMYTFVNNEGVVDAPAVDKADITYDVHPISKTPLIGFKVPLFEEAVDLVKKAAYVVPEIQYVGWDVAISKDKPVIIEGNCFPGVFQRRASFGNNTGILPVYEKVMKI